MQVSLDNFIFIGNEAIMSFFIAIKICKLMMVYFTG